MKNLVLLICLALVQPVLAQNYSISHGTTASGGGSSRGGAFALTGTIGQHDTGVMSGGGFSLQAGFLAGVVVIQTTGAPVLSIRLTGSNAVMSWPLEGSAGFVLQEASSLDPPNAWRDSVAAVITIGNQRSVTVPVNGIWFYRLKRSATAP